MIRYSNDSSWNQQFVFDTVKPLIVCRGPIRKEAIDIFEELGTQPCGILLSEKDSIVYPQTLAPELRVLQDPERVHHVSDYMGSTKAEKQKGIQNIIAICQQHGYTHVFAGYGFMAEDAEFVAALENAKVGFIGPKSSVIQQAGAKDEAKQLARALEVSVTPGVDNLTVLTLLAKAGNKASAYFEQLIKTHNFSKDDQFDQWSTEQQAEWLLNASYEKAIDLISVADLQQEATQQVESMLNSHPGKRIRLKYIGGGGGKGQRIVSSPKDVSAAVMEVLIESKVTDPGNNRNILIELNIEDTRHNEIQLLGNGQWCIALGGRDCSLQMHEQKLFEVSITPELLNNAAAQTLSETARKTLEQDATVLDRMCQEAERFGEAVRLNSASTFECIVEEDSHYFMEMNTRIQVEHRVTEMVYSLKFVSPQSSEDFFVLDSLVGAMLFIAIHGDKLPLPEKQPRHQSGTEVRINATNAALQPHAGGIIQHWNPPTEEELRDDQGIGVLNPDTQQFQAYHLAGAYDSNIALSVTHGDSRLENFASVAEVLRTMEIRGHDLQLNTHFHYGLTHWLIGQGCFAKPNTQFVQSYLAMAGFLATQSQQIDLDHAWKKLCAELIKEHGKDVASVLTPKWTLLTRPLKILLSNPHLLVGWLAPRPDPRWLITKNDCRWEHNPLHILETLYHYLRLEHRPDAAAAEMIWEDDWKVLQTGLQFYEDLQDTFKAPLPWPELQQQLASEEAPGNLSKKQWDAIRAAHQGFQAGLSLLKLPVLLAIRSQFYEMKIREDLSIEVPELFRNPETRDSAITALAPPPQAESNEVVSATGGTFYSKETPDAEPYVIEGQHVAVGETLGILEVMKMFNPIRAEFSGTISKICVDGTNGCLVKRAQTLFEVEPDVAISTESPEERQRHKEAFTQELLEAL